MILVVGVFVTLITMIAVTLVGLRQAASPLLSRRDDLTRWEWNLVREERERRAARSAEDEDT